MDHGLFFRCISWLIDNESLHQGWFKEREREVALVMQVDGKHDKNRC